MYIKRNYQRVVTTVGFFYLALFTALLLIFSPLRADSFPINKPTTPFKVTAFTSHVPITLAFNGGPLQGSASVNSLLGIFNAAQTLQNAQAVNNQSQQQKPKTDPPAQPTQPTAPAKPAFDPNNPATWPTCPAGDIVRADNGQCAAPATPTAATASYTTPAPAGTTVAGCGDNSYANFIYMHESGCSTYNPNPSSGACGLGQAEPCSKLLAACPGLDYACENAWFTAYANKYGGWAGAYAFWIANHWW